MCGGRKEMLVCGKSRTVSYYADVVHFVVSREACEGFSGGARFGNCQVFIMWSVQTIQPLSSLEDRHPCLVLESAYLLI